ncbi:MAG: restriction endonuclease [bacterium]|nr:restriction endonuclease [bacterium]
MSNEKTLWGLHAGRTGDANTLFLKQERVAIGWPEMGDLNTLFPNRDSFKTKYIKTYPAEKPGAVPLNTGQIFRFIHEIQVNDIVIYPAKHTRSIHIGQVIGEYEYNPQLSSAYPHQRSVKWLRELPRTHFSQGALYEIGSAMSLFQVKSYAEEFIAAVESKTAPQPIPVAKDETVAVIAEEIEATTRDFILKSLAQEFKGHPFSHFIAHLLETMGYRTRVSPPGPDGGIDIVAHKDELGFEPPIIKVQVKSGETNVGLPEVQALYGAVEGNKQEYGLFITLGDFTAPALNFARNRSNLRLIGGGDLVQLVIEHYEAFDSRYKGRLPLKRVYVPNVSEED